GFFWSLFRTISRFICFYCFGGKSAKRYAYLYLLNRKQHPKRASEYCEKGSALYVRYFSAFLFAGTYIKSFFGISLASIRVAGGLVILRSAWTMLMPGANTKMTDEDKESVKTKNDVSFSPLAMPLL